MSKVLIFMAEGHEEIEALTVVDLLRRAGIEIEMVSITGNKRVPGSHGIMTVCDKLIEQVNFDSADMLVLPGGMPGTLNLELCEPLMDQVHGFNTSKKGLAAICAAPTVLGKAGLLQGKKATCYPGMEGDLLGANVSTMQFVTMAISSQAEDLAQQYHLPLRLLRHFRVMQQQTR